MFVGEAQPFAAERQQPFQRRGVGAEGRRAEEERLLAGLLVLVEQDHHQPGPATEPAEHRALADPGGRGDIVHRDRVGALFGDEPAGGVEQQRPVARGVAPLLRRAGRHRAGSFLHFNPAGIKRTMVRLLVRG